MTKKDYVKLAQALMDSRPMSETIQDDSEWQHRITTWKNMVNMIADTLKHDNPRFDRDRFLAACGYGK